MVVMKSSPESSCQRSARKVLKKYSVLSSPSNGGVTKQSSYYKLKRVVPTISAKENISRLDVVLEAISYIQMLQSNLVAGVEEEEEQEQQMKPQATNAAAAEEKDSSRKCC